MTDPRAWQMAEDRGPDSLEAHLRKLIADLGLWGYHPRNPIGSARGWPDWVIIGRRIIHRELKSQDGRASRDQLDVGRRIKAAGGDWEIWRPSDFYDGTIAEQLGRLAR